MNTEPAREWMINHQIRPWHVTDSQVLDSLAQVKREHFVPERYRELAFADTAIPLPCGQWMLKPVEEGRILQALDPDEDDTVLLIGTGSGYLAACIARMTRHVTAIDLYEDLTEAAAERFRAEHIRNAELATADFASLDPGTTYDCIVLTGSLPVFDPRLPYWLNPGGRIVATTGTAPTMHVELVTRGEEEYRRIQLFETVIPPLEHVRGYTGFHF